MIFFPLSQSDTQEIFWFSKFLQIRYTYFSAGIMLVNLKNLFKVLTLNSFNFWQILHIAWCFHCWLWTSKCRLGWSKNTESWILFKFFFFFYQGLVINQLLINMIFSRNSACTEKWNFEICTKLENEWLWFSLVNIIIWMMIKIQNSIFWYGNIFLQWNIFQNITQWKNLHSRRINE